MIKELDVKIYKERDEDAAMRRLYQVKWNRPTSDMINIEYTKKN